MYAWYTYVPRMYNEYVNVLYVRIRAYVYTWMYLPKLLLKTNDKVTVVYKLLQCTLVVNVYIAIAILN